MFPVDCSSPLACSFCCSVRSLAAFHLARWNIEDVFAILVSMQHQQFLPVYTRWVDKLYVSIAKNCCSFLVFFTSSIRNVHQMINHRDSQKDCFISSWWWLGILAGFLNLVQSDPRVPGSVVVVTRLDRDDFSIKMRLLKTRKIWNYMENICEIHRNHRNCTHFPSLTCCLTNV